ncbi:MAG TPA: dethiobiotin synthase [Gemmatimonadaceae bacterium]|nr:dethiobiotin synthase [Gemmatimonadaceae bacterium]
MIRLGITGSDTGVGKTMVACGLASALVRRDLVVAAVKPVETGVVFDDPRRDGARLSCAAGGVRPLADTAPLTFRAPLAPTVAAAREHREIDLPSLEERIARAAAGADVLIVEGAGGLLVPVVGTLAFDALFARWSLGLIIVAANRLGVINHTRLTIAAARAANLAVRAVVLNRVASATDESAADNAAVIAGLDHVRVVELPWLSDPDDLVQAREAVERAGLVDIVAAAAALT